MLIILYRTCIKLGGDKIPFKKEEMEAIKQFDSPSIKLMGFKPATCLKNYHNLKSSYFVFPNDEVINFYFLSCNFLLENNEFISSSRCFD